MKKLIVLVCLMILIFTGSAFAYTSLQNGVYLEQTVNKADVIKTGWKKILLDKYYIQINEPSILKFNLITNTGILDCKIVNEDEVDIMPSDFARCVTTEVPVQEIIYVDEGTYMMNVFGSFTNYFDTHDQGTFKVKATATSLKPTYTNKGNSFDTANPIKLNQSVIGFFALNENDLSWHYLKFTLNAKTKVRIVINADKKFWKHMKVYNNYYKEIYSQSMNDFNEQLTLDKGTYYIALRKDETRGYKYNVKLVPVQ